MGFGVASLIRSAEGSSAVVNVVLLPMAFLSGAFGPARHLPKVLAWIADALPLKYFVELADSVYLDGLARVGQAGCDRGGARLGRGRARGRAPALRLGAAGALTTRSSAAAVRFARPAP